MTDPYRSADGTPCLRCGLALVVDDDGDLACPDGCGRWIPAAAIAKLLGTSQLQVLARPIAHWKATPFAAASCPVCRVNLAAQYMPLPGGEVLSHGYCAEHGAWLDRSTHAEFAAAYGKEIEAHQRPVGSAANRIAELEERVAKLERQLAEVRDYVGRERWSDWKE